VSETRWVVFLYHDTSENAAEQSEALPIYFTTEEQAIRTAKRSITAYWQTAQVCEGEWTPRIPGVRPDHWEQDERAIPVRVGKGWVERG
jgi:hypothetical protein